MKVLEVRNINIEPSSIREALADLEAAIAKSTQMKELLEQLLALSTGDGAKARSRRRGRPKGKRSKAQEKTAAKGSGRKAARGMTLRQAIVKVLKSAGKPLRPIDLCRKVLDAGYKSKATAESFYTAVFSTAKKEPMVQKLDKAFALKKGAAVAASATGKTAKRGAKRKARKAKPGRKAMKRRGRPPKEASTGKKVGRPPKAASGKKKVGRPPKKKKATGKSKAPAGTKAPPAATTA